LVSSPWVTVIGSMSKVWFGPWAFAAMAAAQVLGGIGSISQGNTAKDLAGQQSAAYREQADMVNLEAIHAHEDLAIKRSRTLATSKAVMAAQGGGQDIGILSAQDAQFGAKDKRIDNEAYLKKHAIYSRANLVDAQGSAEQSAGLMKGLTQFAGAGANLFKFGKEMSA
jgi:hypothetical protein